MRRYISIALLLIGMSLQAQEAFYVYRNDGDFNGFFYDEVLSMGYSKIGIDSVEYDEYVVQEVVLADTTYRIPLAAIDSIGFQQPEIRFNPKVRFLVRDGYEPYLAHVKTNGCTFQDLPGNKPLAVGDIIVGLPTDPRAEEMYINTPGNLGSGSFTCIVDEIETGSYNGSTITYITGHPVSKINEVFDQYITVEQVTVDKNNQVRRRIAGCTDDGFPRKVVSVSDGGEMDLFDISFNLTREWQPGGSGKVDLSAEIGLKDRMRVAYNITWKRFYAKLTNELTAKVKPSLGIQLNTSYEVTSDDWASLPHVMFPAACPVFETNPQPMFFFRADGTVEARLNMPAVQLGLAADFIMDTDNLFPVSFGMHMVPDESTKVDEDMLDLSAGVTFKGMIQTGIKFQLNVATANWFKKVLMTDLGLHLYIGPKLQGAITFTSDICAGLTEDIYPTLSIAESLSKANINFSLLSIDLEAKAKAAAFWKDPVEKKFFDTNLSLIKDTIFFAPAFDPITIDYDSTTFDLTVHLHPRKRWVMGGSRIQLAMRTTYEHNVYHLIDPIYDVGPKDADTIVDYTFNGIRCGGEQYHFFPVVHVGTFGKVRGLWEKYYVPTLYLELDKDSVVFGAKDNLKQEIIIKTNTIRSEIQTWKKPAYPGWIDTNNSGLETVDDEAGIYKMLYEATPNETVFDRETFAADSLHPYIGAYPDIGYHKNYSIGMYQSAPDLSNVTISISASFKDTGNKARGISFLAPAIVTPKGKDFVHVEGTYVDTGIVRTTKTYTVSLDFERTKDYDKNGYRMTLASGTVTYHSISELTSTKKEIRTEVSFSKDNVKGTTNGASGALSSGTHQEWDDDSMTVDAVMGEGGSVNFSLTAK